jgi:hypothetical protein
MGLLYGWVRAPGKLPRNVENTCATLKTAGGQYCSAQRVCPKRKSAPGENLRKPENLPREGASLTVGLSAAEEGNTGMMKNARGRVFKLEQIGLESSMRLSHTGPKCRKSAFEAEE